MVRILWEHRKVLRDMHMFFRPCELQKPRNGAYTYEWREVYIRVRHPREQDI